LNKGSSRNNFRQRRNRSNFDIDSILHSEVDDEEPDDELDRVLQGEEENEIFSEFEQRNTLSRRLLRSTSSTSARAGNRRRVRGISTSEAEALYASAMENTYEPSWSSVHKGSNIYLDGNVAYTLEANEGCVRSLEAIPKKKNIGWKIVLEHSREKGKSMGGCYLVGVTTGSFHGFGERSGLQSSRLFWGVEDGGRRYEGSTSMRNRETVLFGSLEILTIILDHENKTLNYWRDGEFLGTLVSNLPKSALYPVAVPFNAGVSVTICGMDKDPMQLLTHYHSNLQKKTKELNQLKKIQIEEEKKIFLSCDKLSDAFLSVIKRIVTWYTGTDKGENVLLDSIMIHKLWYRCGFSFEYLDIKDGVYSTQQFVMFLNNMIKEEQEKDVVMSDKIEIGDKVEVIEGYERHGDAASGPLKVGDRGVVMELQRGREKQSVRVEFMGRRWWYYSVYCNKRLIKYKLNIIKNIFLFESQTFEKSTFIAEVVFFLSTVGSNSPFSTP